MIELYSISMDPQKQQFEWQKQSVVYNGYGPTETTLGTVFSSEVLPPQNFLHRKNV